MKIINSTRVVKEKVPQIKKKKSWGWKKNCWSKNSARKSQIFVTGDWSFPDPFRTVAARPKACKLDYLNMDFDDGDLKELWDTDLDAVSNDGD